MPTYTLVRDWKLDAKSPQVQLEQKAAEQARTWAQGLEFHSAGKTVEPKFVSAAIGVADGTGGLAVARFTSVFELAGVKSPLTFEDHNFPDRAGWKEIVIGSGLGAELVSASQGNNDRSLPNIRRIQPSRRHRICEPLSNGGSAARWFRAARPKSYRSSSRNLWWLRPRLREIWRKAISCRACWPRTTSDGNGCRGLVAAFGIGGAHALEPGHRKTLVAAYLVGSRGNMKHAAILGGVVTFTHTISVFLLGAAMLLLSASVVPGKVIRVLEAASGLSIVAIGAGDAGRASAAAALRRPCASSSP